jgi:hypothetical protein
MAVQISRNQNGDLHVQCLFNKEEKKEKMSWQSTSFLLPFASLSSSSSSSSSSSPTCNPFDFETANTAWITAEIARNGKDANVSAWDNSHPDHYYCSDHKRTTFAFGSKVQVSRIDPSLMLKSSDFTQCGICCNDNSAPTAVSDSVIANYMRVKEMKQKKEDELYGETKSVTKTSSSSEFASDVNHMQLAAIRFELVQDRFEEKSLTEQHRAQLRWDAANYYQEYYKSCWNTSVKLRQYAGTETPLPGDVLREFRRFRLATMLRYPPDTAPGRKGDGLLKTYCHDHNCVVDSLMTLQPKRYLRQCGLCEDESTRSRSRIKREQEEANKL